MTTPNRDLTSPPDWLPPDGHYQVKSAGLGTSTRGVALMLRIGVPNLDQHFSLTYTCGTYPARVVRTSNAGELYRATCFAHGRMPHIAEQGMYAPQEIMDYMLGREWWWSKRVVGSDRFQRWLLLPDKPPAVQAGVRVPPDYSHIQAWCEIQAKEWAEKQVA